MKIKQAASEFLGHRRVAVTGVSRSPKTHGANVVYRRLRESGYDVFAINPNATVVEGDPCYPNLAAIPGGVEAVVMATGAERVQATMEDCDELGIGHVWMHRGPGPGSVSPAAAAYGRAHGISVIAGGCPLMFGPTSDRGHKVMRVVLASTRKLPREVPGAARPLMFRTWPLSRATNACRRLTHHVVRHEARRAAKNSGLQTRPYSPGTWSTPRACACASQ
jgi:predicted CoA-binding protein